MDLHRRIGLIAALAIDELVYARAGYGQNRGVKLHQVKDRGTHKAVKLAKKMKKEKEKDSTWPPRGKS